MVQECLRALFLTVCLCAPLFVVSGLLPSQPSVEGWSRQPIPQVMSVFEKLGKISNDGVQRLIEKVHRLRWES